MDDLAIFYPEGHAAHAEPGHPERPDRVEAIRQGLQETGWWQRAVQLTPLDLSLEFITQIHHPGYLEILQKACARGMYLDGDTYTTPASWQLALNAAGGAAAVAEAVWNGRFRSGFALCRPPGHHATPRRGMGFCLLNNIALAAQHLLQGPVPGAANAHQLAIVDLDLHHGNGTQDIFWARRDVAFMSIHQSPLYPGTGAVQEQGAGEGLGYTVNLPLPPGSGDAAFRAGVEQVFLPMLDRFAPQMLLVSVGFDPHWRDPLGSLQLSAAGLLKVISMLRTWAEHNCEGKIALVLEGGYDLEAGQACARAAVAALQPDWVGETWQDPLGACSQPESSAWVNSVHTAQRLHKV